MAWAKENRQELPRDYRGLLAYPLDERRAIYTHLSATEKAAFWSGKIASYLEEHPQLSAVERQAVAEAQAFLTPEIYTATAAPDSPARARVVEQLNAMATRVTLGLGEAAAQELLYGLGPEAKAKSGAKTSTSLGPSCDCAFLLDCKSPANCWDLPCLVKPSGCGIGGNFPCDGVCNFE